MNADGKSDRPIVPVKSPNKAEGTAAEAMEGRGRTKGNLLEGNTLRLTQRSIESNTLWELPERSGT